MTKLNLRRQILKKVKEFYLTRKKEKYTPGKTSINYAGRIYDEKELINLVDASLDFWLTAGRYAQEFEESLARFLGVKYCLLTNSGSSANLLAISALTSPALGEKRLKPGDEVITIACGFPTTLNPIIQNNLVPVFVDVELGTYNIRADKLKAAISDKTKAIIIPHTLGNPARLSEIMEVVKKHQLWFIEDNCFVGNTLIPTKEKTKKIKDIKIGDRLLGYNDYSFQETIVENVFSRLAPKADLLAIKFENGTTVRCTKEHPFYIKGKWVKAQDIKVGDEVYHSSWSEYVAWRRTHILSEKGRESVSSHMKKNNPSFNPENVKKSATNRFKKQTHIEKRVAEVIQEYNLPIKYVGNSKFWIGSTKDGYRKPDFIFNEKKILIEILDPTYKKYSSIRNTRWKEERRRFFTKFGFETHYVELTGWINRKQKLEIADKLRSIISNGIKVLSIKPIRNCNILNGKIKEPKNMVRVYNLKCSPHNNFCLTGGLLVHNCDSLGSKFNGRYTGTFGHLSTCSFYPPHHITTGEGGAVLTSDPRLKRIVLSFRDWGRDCWCETGCDNTCRKRFGWKMGDLPLGYDHKYIYSHIGYNLKMTDMQAAIGVAQLKKLPGFIKKRRSNFETLLRFFGKYEDYFILPQPTQGSEPSWFGFPLLVRKEAPFKRSDIVNYLEENKIATRMLFGGNLTKQPAYKNIKCRSAGPLTNTDTVMDNLFWVGVYPGITKEKLDYMTETIRRFLRRKI